MDPRVCLDAVNAFIRSRSAENFRLVQDVVGRGSRLEAAWCSRFESDTGPTLPPLMLLVPLFCTDPADPFFLKQIELVCRMAEATDYASGFIIKNLNVEHLRRFAEARSGKKWQKDPLVKALAHLSIIRLRPKPRP